jgi:hypothetical protein
MVERVPLAINITLPPSTLFCSPHLATNKKPHSHTAPSSSPNSCNQKITPSSHSAPFLSQLLQPTKNPILTQCSLPLPMEPMSPRGAAQATSSSSSDERGCWCFRPATYQGE